MSRLDEVIQAMNKKSKSTIVTVGLPTYTHERIPFTSPRMNYCTFGGIPKGKITELFGEEHGGKRALIRFVEAFKIENLKNYIKNYTKQLNS